MELYRNGYVPTDIVGNGHMLLFCYLFVQNVQKTFKGNRSFTEEFCASRDEYRIQRADIKSGEKTKVQ